MSRFTNVVRLSALLISLLATVSTVMGCGLMPPGQSTTRTFNMTGFSLPVAMVFSTAANVPAQAPGIATSMMAAQAFVSRVVMQAVFDVLERQGRSAGLSDAIIAIILGQLTVEVNYTPLECGNVFVNPMPAMRNMITMGVNNCVIIGNTVTAICFAMQDGQMCMTNAEMNVIPIPRTALSIGGTLTTTNVIMANWSREMWQGVVNRVVQTLASGPLGSNFFSASATVS